MILKIEYDEALDQWAVVNVMSGFTLALFDSGTEAQAWAKKYQRKNKAPARL